MSRLAVSREVVRRLSAYPPLFRAARGLYATGSVVAAMTRDRGHRAGVTAIEDEIARIETRQPGARPPVVIVDLARATSRLTCHTATSRLIGWALRLAGQSAIYATCGRAVPQCLFSGANQWLPDVRPPCATCTHLRTRWYPAHLTYTCTSRMATLTSLARAVETAPLAELLELEWHDLPLGRLCAPSARWLLRRHDLAADPGARALLQRFIMGAASLATSFGELIDEQKPRAFVVYNGAFYGEATVGAVARQHGVPVVSHEIGWVPGRMFISRDDATRYRIPLPEGYAPSGAEDVRFDEYLTRRFRGDFRMGATRFWPEMQTLPPALEARMAGFQNVATVFSNVVFDTSQIYANTVFDGMFAWLDATLGLAAKRPETLFVVRAHPDEFLKQSLETVATWLEAHPARRLPNVALIPASEYVSSYDLVRSSKLVIVYNSTIGLEAMILGKPVVCGGHTRYLDATAAVHPKTPELYADTIAQYLDAPPVTLDDRERERARRYMHYTYFKACLDLAPWIGTGLMVPDGLLTSSATLRREAAPEMDIIVRGVLDGEAFAYA